MNKIIINKKRIISNDSPCFVVAEAGVNHDGSLEKAKELIDVAVEAKADAVKFQLFNTKKYASNDAFLATYHKKGRISKKENIKQLLKRLELSQQQYFECVKYAKKRGIFIFCTPFDVGNLNFLNKLKTEIFKMASFSLTNYPLLEATAKTKKPIILSCGLHTLGEIEDAVNLIKKYNNNLILLQCTSHYPSEPKDANLNVMHTLKNAFNCITGYSDHTMGINVSLAAVAMGAKVIEKHYTLDTSDYGVDHDASISPEELKQLVIGVREIEASIGTGQKIIPEIEKEIQRVHRPSLISKTKIKKGQRITRAMLDIKKPGIGIHPRDMKWVINRIAKNTIEKDRLIKSKDLI